jgi:hypothetical protein
MLKPCEKSSVIEVTVKSEGDKTFGVLLSTAGGVFQAPQVDGTENFSISVENVTVRLESKSVFEVEKSAPTIGIRVVELVYALFGVGIRTKPAFAAGIQRSRPAHTAILEKLKSLVVMLRLR